MRPSKRVNRIIGGIFARYAELLSISIYALKVLSNHYHILIQAPLGNADEFEENVNREIARRLNWKNRRTGKFWYRRYDDLKVITENDLLQAFLYVTTNAVKHGLVENPALWPGITSYHQSLGDKSVKYPFHHYSAEEGEEKVTYHTLKITPLPQFAHISKHERLTVVKRYIEEKTDTLVKERREAGLGFLGVEAIKAQDPNDTPLSVARSPRPCVYTKDISLYKEHRMAMALRRQMYDEASRRYRLGDLAVEFPIYTFKPPLHRKPRRSPFQELTAEHLKISF